MPEVRSGQVFVLSKAPDVRIVAPLMMEETLLPAEALPDERKHDQCVQLSYAVTGSGLLEQGTDLVKMCAFATQSCVACCCL